jgi:hypothetical protein
MESEILKKDKIWNRIKKYIYLIILLFVLLLILITILLVMSLRSLTTILRIQERILI